MYFVCYLGKLKMAYNIALLEMYAHCIRLMHMPTINYFIKCIYYSKLKAYIDIDTKKYSL